jgi:hypothetical protein
MNPVKITENDGFIEFHFKNNDTLSAIKTNTYQHCNFQKLNIGRAYTSINYIGGV